MAEAVDERTGLLELGSEKVEAASEDDDDEVEREM